MIDDYEMSGFHKIRRTAKLSINERINYNAIKELLDFKDKKVLDIGCGQGYLLSELGKKGNECTGVDLIRENPFKVKKILLDVDFEKMPFGKKEFDVAIINSFIEHSARPAKVLREAASSIKKNGFVLIGIPNEFILRNRYDFLLGKTPSAHKIDAYGHKYLASIGDWKEFFSEFFGEVRIVKMVPFREKSIIGMLSRLFEFLGFESSYKIFIFKCSKPKRRLNKK